VASDNAPAAALEVRHATKIYPRRSGSEAVDALRDVSLSVAPGEFVTLVGPSGCGKSTLLSAIAGLHKLSSGEIFVGGNRVVGAGPDRGVVFQQASLLPWRTVRHNISYGMEMQRSPGRSERQERVEWALRLVGLTDAAERYPNQLSGGMQQRVNLARALATRPKLLLMDEPFGALDAMTKSHLQLEVSRISSDTGVTVVFVTHDIDEALMLADRVVVMSRGPGRISQIFEVSGSRPRSAEFAETRAFAELRRELRLSIDHTLTDSSNGSVPVSAKADAG
jgi:NitT/TauT family transport system ATP-binding protein